jgi:signal transduction histidine kinase
MVAVDERQGRFPVAFRRRLAVAFVLVAGISAGALALGSMAVMESQRGGAFAERARENVQRDLRLLRAGSSPRLIADRLQSPSTPGGPGVVVVREEGAISSVERLDVSDVPTTLDLAGAEPDELRETTAELDGDPYLVIGVRAADVDAELYYFFPRQDLLRALAEFRRTLAIGWVVIVVSAGVAGMVVARRTLRPVQEAADAAQAVAEGLLETRLEVSGTDEFAQWASSFNEMVGALDEKIAALAAARDRERRFNADVAHELRTPLGALVTSASLLEARADELPPSLHRPLALVVDGARRLHRLTDELLELHRLEVGQEQVDWEVFDVGESLEAAIRGHGWDRDITVERPAAAVVHADRRRLDRIVVNLLSNALDHGAPPVVATVDVEGDHAVLTVRDHGPGIPAEDVPYLFDRYFKVSRSRTAPAASRRSSGGSGLGLAIASENAKLLGGEVAVVSHVDGTAFTVRLPLAGADADAGDTTAVEAPSAPEREAASP